MSNKSNLRYSCLPVLTSLLAGAALNLNAQTASEDYSIVTTWLGQGNAAVNGNQALKDNSCVPTSVANGLSYLDAYQISLGNASPFTTSPNNYAAVNSLQTVMGTTAAGTFLPPALSGLQTYLTGPVQANRNPAPNVISWQIFDPSAQSLADLLTAHAAVQLGILWGSVNNGVFTAAGGGHFVSLESISLSEGSGTINVLDPWGGGISHANTSAAEEPLSVTTVNITGQGDYLQVKYSVTISGPDFVPGDLAYAGNGQSGIITVGMIETVGVPEPSTVVMSVVIFAGGGIYGFRQLRRKVNQA